MATALNPNQHALNIKELILKMEIRPGMHVGDFGVGGAAPFAMALAQQVGANGSVLMFDVLKSALSAALSAARQQGFQNCQAVWANLEIYEGARGIGPNSLDAGLLINVLSQSQKHQDMLTEIHRMLKPGARLLVVDWQPGAENPIAPEKDRRLAADHVSMLGQTVGFASLERFAANPHEWGLVLVKT